MVALLSDFKKNVAEVEVFFELLGKIESGYTALSNQSKDVFLIDRDLSRILKANAFLILYNLIESTIKSGLWEVFENVKNDSLSYKDLLLDLKKIWVDHKIQFDNKTKQDTINEKVLNTIDDALNNTINYYNSKRNVKFKAGNLNIKGINAAFKTHGLRTIGVHQNIENSFRTTTKNRNELAHGDLSFIDCGKNYSYKDLRIAKLHVVRYLIKCLIEIDDFIVNKKYKVAVT